MPQQNDCADLPAHLAAHQVQKPQPGDKNEPQNDMERLAANVAGPKSTMPTGYVSHCEPEAQGSGTERYTEAWDTGFAQDGDPYGIQSEYVSQSASPNAAIPTQEDADRVNAEAEAEMKARREE